MGIARTFQLVREFQQETLKEAYSGSLFPCLPDVADEEGGSDKGCMHYLDKTVRVRMAPTMALIPMNR